MAVEATTPAMGARLDAPGRLSNAVRSLFTLFLQRRLLPVSSASRAYYS
ncbi:MAG: hypothetical protein AB7D07_06180 [Desulfovibrionaceae bacterium]